MMKFLTKDRKNNIKYANIWAEDTREKTVIIFNVRWYVAGH